MQNYDSIFFQWKKEHMQNLDRDLIFGEKGASSKFG